MAMNRIPSLDGLRGIAALAVMTFHFNYFFLPQAGLLDIIPGLRRAYLGVDLFFLLSGFVMAHMYGQKLATDWRQHWREFARVRFARIYPLFALTTLSLVMAHAVFSLPIGGVSFSARSLALQPLLLQCFGRGLSWNYPGWSISTEAAAYVLFVFAAAALVRGRYPRVAAVACIVTLAGVSGLHHGSLHVYSGWSALLRTLAEFGLGALLHRADASGARVAHGRVALIAVTCLGLAAVSGWDIFLVAALACLIHHGTDGSTPVARLLDSRGFVALGAWSYSVYLWHAPTHYAVMGLFAAAGHPLAALSRSQARAVVLATMLTVIALSAVSLQYFERPLRLSIRRRLSATEDSSKTPFA